MSQQQNPNQSNPTFRTPAGTMWTYVPLNTIAHELQEMQSIFNIQGSGTFMAYRHPNTCMTHLVVFQHNRGIHNDDPTRYHETTRVFAFQQGLGFYGGELAGMNAQSSLEPTQKLDDWLLGKILITQIGEWLKPAGRGPEVYGDPKTYKPIPLLDCEPPVVSSDEISSTQQLYETILLPLFGSSTEEKDWEILESGGIAKTDKIYDAVHDLCEEQGYAVIMQHPAGKVVVALFWSRNIAQLKEIVLLNHFNDERGYLVSGRIHLSPKFIETSNIRDHHRNHHFLHGWLHDKTGMALPKLANIVMGYPKEMFAGKTKENYDRMMTSHRAAEEEKKSLDVYFGSMQDVFLRLRSYLTTCIDKYSSLHLPSNFVDVVKTKPLNWEIIVRESLKLRQTNQEVDDRLMAFVNGILNDLVSFATGRPGIVPRLIVSGVAQIFSDKDAFNQPRRNVVQVMEDMGEHNKKVHDMLRKEEKGGIGSFWHFVSSIVPINTIPTPGETSIRTAEEALRGPGGMRDVLENVLLRLAVVRVKKNLLSQVIVQILIDELSLMAHYVSDGHPTFGFQIHPQRVYAVLSGIGEKPVNHNDITNVTSPLVISHMGALYSMCFQHQTKNPRAPETQSVMEERLMKMAEFVTELYDEIFGKEPQQPTPRFRQPGQQPGFDVEQNFVSVNLRLEQLERQMQGLFHLERQMKEVIEASRVPAAPFIFGNPMNPFQSRGVQSSPWEFGPRFSL